MTWFNKKQKFTEDTVTEDSQTVTYKYDQYGTPFLKVGKNDITKPYIFSGLTGQYNYVYFGADNLYPQLIDQMYFQSPLHSSIIDFQINAAIGGGYTLEGDDSSKERVKRIVFEKKHKLQRLVKATALDLKMHRRVHFLITVSSGVPAKVERILPAKVRYNKTKEVYSISNNWATTEQVRTVKAYPANGSCEDGDYMFSYIDLESSPGQDIYPLPKECAAFNWIFLDGESSVLQKKNIERSIFGSLVIKRPKKFESREERDEFISGIKTKEGDVAAALIFSADGRDNLPDVATFPANQNDKAFEGMFTRIDEKICQAHALNPVLLLEGTGGLGSGSDITAVYPIYEKNIVAPFREDIECVINELLFLFDVKSDFKLNSFQIIGGEIVNQEATTDKEADARAMLKGSVGGVQGIIGIQTAVTEGVTDRGSAIALLELIYGFSKPDATRLLGTVQEGEGVNTDTTMELSRDKVTQPPVNTALKGLTAKENQDMYRIIRDFKKGRLNEKIAIARLNAYGLDSKTSLEILND